MKMSVFNKNSGRNNFGGFLVLFKLCEFELGHP